MSSPISRRSVLAIAGASASLNAFAGVPNFIKKAPAKPGVVASTNGYGSKGPDGKTCVETALEIILRGGDVLDAVIAGVNIVELDPKDQSVGYGGIPNADGVVQLDSCCMHGPLRRAGGVAALEGVRTPSKVARAVMDMTDHHLLVGAGAQEFARNVGFEIESDLNTPDSRRVWLEWKRRTDPSHYLSPKDRGMGEDLEVLAGMVRDGWIDKDHVFGTINCNGVSAKGEVCGVTTTSGLGFKIPGRVGDSPILGAGLYVDNGVGAAGSTGRGEANLYNLCSFLIIEEMRRGRHPQDAAVEALRRVAKNTVEKRLLDAEGHPNFGLNFYVIDNKGNVGGGTFVEGGQFVHATENGVRHVDCAFVYPKRG